MILISDFLDIEEELSDALAVLQEHDFPGNVRELQGMVFDAVSRTRGEVLELDALAASVAG